MTRKLKIGLAAAAGAVALTAGGATLYAQSGMHGPMAEFDADSSGAVSLAEARAGVAKMFAGADSNKDGRATREEMMAYHDKMGDHPRGGHKGGHKGGHGHGSDHGGKDHVVDGPMHLDSDGDGALTLAETQSGIVAHFAKIDSNRDGSVTEAEMRAAHEAHHGGK